MINSSIHEAILEYAETFRGKEFEIKLSAGQHLLSGLVLNASLTFSRIKITAANDAFLSSSALTLLTVRAGAPPVELHGLVLDGQVLIEGGTVEIAGCRFNGSARAGQGRRLRASTVVPRALLISGGSATVSDTVFEGLLGGAIEVSGGDLTVHTTAFEKNEAASGGALLVMGGEVHVRNSTFIENFATEGGALFVNMSGDVRVNNSAFIGNDASESGGTIRVIGPNATLELANFTQITAAEGNGSSVASDVVWTFVLPAQLGHYVNDTDQDGVAQNDGGADNYFQGDYPFPCSATLVVGIITACFLLQNAPLACPARLHRHVATP